MFALAVLWQNDGPVLPFEAQFAVLIWERDG
jgi:hypothetical protein